MGGGGEAFLERLGAPALLVGPGLVIVAANAEAATVFGAKEGDRCPDLWRTDGRACRSCPVSRVLDGGRPWVGPAPPHGSMEDSPLLLTVVPAGKGGNGDHVLVLVQEYPFKGGEGRGLSLQAAFVGSVTHALKGALNALEGGLYFLEEGHRRKDAGRVESGTAMARRGLWKARSLVGNILTWARPRDLHREEVAVASLVSSAVEACGRRPAAIPVHLEIPPDMAASIPGDPAALEAMLLNLLEVCQEGAAGGPGKVTLRVGIEERRVVFEVVHGGPPFPPEVLEGALAFRYRTEGAGRMGIWLHGAFRIAVAHGGVLEARTEEDAQVFRARLPAE